MDAFHGIGLQARLTFSVSTRRVADQENSILICFFSQLVEIDKPVADRLETATLSCGLQEALMG